LGHTDIAYAILYGKLWFKVPETLYFKLNGKLPENVMAKDFILRIIGDITTEGAAGKAMQFGGSGISDMSVESRLTLTNMTTEAGAKNGIIEPDQKVFDYISERGITKCDPVYDDDDAQYEKTFEYEASELEPLVAKPFSPQNVSPAREINIEIDKSYIGSCTGAKYEDLVAAAKILKGRTVKVRTEVLPATISIFKKATENGLIKIFLDAGAVVGPPTCGACCGAQMGVLAKDEVCVSTTNRNFPGRMGDLESKAYLASPLVTAASAVTGKLTDPRDL
jgi:3-isopropylmalate/(R)-2-methylmalate dehydratase large subunit